MTQRRPYPFSHSLLLALLACALAGGALLGCSSVGETDEVNIYPLFATRVDNPPDPRGLAASEPYRLPSRQELGSRDVIGDALRRSALAGGLRGLGLGVEPVTGYSGVHGGAAPKAAISALSDSWPLDRYVQARDSQATIRFDALAPLVEWEYRYSDRRESYGFHPLFSVMRDPQSGREQVDVLWPLGQFVSEPGHEQYRFLPLFYYDRTEHADGRSDMDMFIFPLFFYGEETFPGEGPDDTDRVETYFAFVPFGGTLRGFLLNDWLEFYLFPLFLHTRQETSQGTFESWYAPWPIIHWGYGAGRHSWHFLPFYAQDIRRELIENEEGELVEGRLIHERYDVLWPLIHLQRNWGMRDVSPDPTRPDYRHTLLQESFMVFPFYGYTQTTTARTTTILWPFFSVEEKPEKGYFAIDAPWPIFRYAEGIGEYEFRLWPIFWESRSVTADGTEHQALRILWPIIWYTRDVNLSRERTSFKILPFFWRDETHYIEPLDGLPPGSEIYTKIWPLFGMHEERDGTRRIEVLSPLPFDDIPGFSNNWAMLWRLFYWEENGDDTVERFRMLGPLIRYERTPTRESFDFNPLFNYRRGLSGEDDPVWEEEFNFLYGLFGWGHDRDGDYLRLFWALKIPLG